jgi:hypothetical protein
MELAKSDNELTVPRVRVSLGVLVLLDLQELSSIVLEMHSLITALDLYSLICPVSAMFGWELCRALQILRALGTVPSCWGRCLELHSLICAFECLEMHSCSAELCRSCGVVGALYGVAFLDLYI